MHINRAFNSLRTLRDPLHLIACALLVASAIPLAAQTPDTSGLISIRLEQLQGQVTRAVPQNTVFHSGDILRFRLSSHLAGYLYVVDKGTTGSITTLFPASGKEANNRIEPNQSYLVPANGDGWFSVSGPPGFDVLYFLVSDTPINLPQSIGPAAQPQPNEAPPPGMLPRCDDEIFKARGDCLDDSAGVAPLAPGTPIPRELTPLAQTASRDIILTDDGDNTVVKPAAAAKLPMIYTFRLAHRE